MFCYLNYPIYYDYDALINVCNLTKVLVSIHGLFIFYCMALSKINVF